MNNITFARRIFKIIYYNLNTPKLNQYLRNTIVTPYILSQQFASVVTFKNKSPLSESKQELTKDTLIKKMNFKCDEHAEPFYLLSISELFTIYKVTKLDNNIGYCTNRLYYVAEQIKCDPKVLGEVIIKRTFIYTHSFDWIESSLKVLLDMGVAGDRILRDLWVLKYHHETIRERLHKVKSSGCDNVYPWMVRCSNVILDRYIKITVETKDILGDNMSTLQYLANRLDTSIEEVEIMCQKVPSLWSIRATKVKSFLDYLLSEGFEKEDIINRPSVLASSLSTASQRIAHLRSLGVTNINLNIICRSRKGFLKYLDTITTVKKY